MKLLIKRLTVLIIVITAIMTIGQGNLIINKIYAVTLGKIIQVNANSQIYNFKIITGEKLINVQEGPNVYKADVSNNDHKVQMQFDSEPGINCNDFVVTGSDNTIVGNISDEQSLVTISNLKEGLNVINIKNRADNAELYKFYINYKNVKVSGLKNVVNAGDELKLDVIIDGKVCKNVEWTSVGISSVMINKDGHLTAVNNGIAYILATIYDENKKNIIGSINVKFNVSGESKLGWVKNAGKWYYIDEQTKSFKTGWLFYNNEWYSLDNNGSMQTGWISRDGCWYYLKPTGNMATGWIKDQSKWYFLDRDGAMKTGWIKDHGIWYYLNNDGSMKKMNNK